MDLSYSEEQRLLKESTERFVAQRYPFEERRRIAASPEGMSRKLWSEMADLGWLGLPIPEYVGGSGGGCVDVAVLMEAFGRGLVLEPYVSTVVLGGGLIDSAGSLRQREALLPAVAAGRLLVAFAHMEPQGRQSFDRVSARAVREGAGYRLTGKKRTVLDAPLADTLLVTARIGDAGLGVLLVPRGHAGLERRDYATVDGRRASDLSFDNMALPAEALLGDGRDLTGHIAHAVDRAIAACSAEIVGAMAVLLEATVAYTKTRVQFGKPLAANQVLRHRMADMTIRLEEARSIALLAAIRAGDAEDAAARARATSAARVKIGAGARFVAEQAVQLHGGMGVTDELDIGAYFKRVMAYEAAFGSTAEHLARYGRHAGRAAVAHD
jgi:hypothetical protein